MSSVVLPVSIVSVFLSLPFLFWLWPAWIVLAGHWRPWKECVRVGVVFGLLGVFQFLVHYLFVWGTAEPSPIVGVNFGSSILFPLSLAALIYVYIAHRAATFGVVCLFLVGVNFLIASLSLIQAFGFFGEFKLFPDRRILYSILVIGCGTILLAIDVIVMIWVFQFTIRWTRRRFALLVLPLQIALLIDSVGFAVVTAVLSDAGYFDVLLPHWISKATMGLVYSICLRAHFYYWNLGLFESQCEVGDMSIWGSAKRATAMTLRWITAVSQFQKSFVDDQTQVPGLTEYTFRVISFQNEDGFLKDKSQGMTKDWLDAIEAYEQVRTALLSTNQGKWVAFVGRQQIAIRDSEKEIDTACERLIADGIDPFVIRIGPPMPEVDAFDR